MKKWKPVTSTIVSSFLLTVLVLAGALPAAATIPDSDQAPGVGVWQGWLTIIWGDGQPAAQPGTATDYLLIDDEGRSIRLLLDEALARPWGGLLALNRQWVVVEGRWRAAGAGVQAEVEVETIRPDGAPSPEGPGQIEDVIGPQPWVSLLCKFSDIANEPEPLLYFEEMYGSSHPGLDHYWREQSYDLANVVGSDAVGWYTLPQPRSYYVYDRDGDGDVDLDFTRAANDCTGVADEDVYFPDFVGINLMFNAVLDCCAWGGGWYMELDGVYKYYRMTWEPPWGYANQGVIGHEMGHGFSLPHSSGTYGQTYDNQWDVMSDVWSNCSSHPTYGCLGQHTISYHKDRLGWVADEQKYEVTPGSQATVVLEQLALPQSNNYLMAQVPIDPGGTRFYTAEARRWQGYDVKLPGQAVIIHEVDTGRSIPAHVIDADGNGNTGDAGAMWLPGETFVDATEGITIHVLSETATGFVIGIETEPLPLSNVALSGPAQGLTGEPYLFEVEASPATASQPITYTWRATDHSPLAHSSGLTDSAVFSWTTPGPKSVVVTATNRAGDVAASTSLPIYGPLAAAFVTSSPDWLGQTTTFSNTTAGMPPITFTWDLGDGTTSEAEHPEHAYAAPGLYTVCLTATNPAGSAVMSDVVAVYGPPEADLAAQPTAGEAPLTVAFTATATTLPPGDPTLSYSWDFGDGGTSGQVTPSHTYMAMGVYTVRLTVQNAAGSDTVTRTEYITVEGAYRVYLPIVLRQLEE